MNEYRDIILNSLDLRKSQAHVTLSTILVVVIVSIVEVIWAVDTRLIHHVVVEVIQLLN